MNSAHPPSTPAAPVAETPTLPEANEHRYQTVADLQRNLAAREAELATLRERVAQLEGALALGQANCDDVYNDLKRERDVAKSKLSIAVREHAEEAGHLKSLVADGDANFSNLVKDYQIATERAERAERERDGLKTSGMDADTCIEIEELKKFKARLEWLGNPANKFAYSIEKDGEVKVGTRWDFQRFKTLSAAIDHFRGINSAHAASADGHARKEEAP